MSKKRKVWVICILCVAIATWFLYCMMYPLPWLGRVSSIMFRGWSEDIVINIESEHWPEIWNALQPARYDLLPAKWVVLGTLEIKFVHSGSMVVHLYSLKEGSAAFKIGMYYRGGSSAKLKEIMQKIRPQ